MGVSKKYKIIRQFLLIFIGIPLLIWALSRHQTDSYYKDAFFLLTILMFCQMAGMFFWSRINRYVGKVIKRSQIIKCHKMIGYTCMLVMLLHPFFPVVPKFFEPGISPVDAFVTIITTFNRGIVLGIFAWGLMLILGVTAFTRKGLPVSYSTWRRVHGILAVSLVFISAWHGMVLGCRSNTAITIFIIILPAGSILLFGMYHILKLYNEIHI